MEKAKQRTVYFTDKEWDEVQKAAEKSPQRNRTHFVSEIVMKATRRLNK